MTGIPAFEILIALRTSAMSGVRWRFWFDKIVRFFRFAALLAHRKSPSLGSKERIRTAIANKVNGAG